MSWNNSDDKSQPHTMRFYLVFLSQKLFSSLSLERTQWNKDQCILNPNNRTMPDWSWMSGRPTHQPEPWSTSRDLVHIQRLGPHPDSCLWFWFRKDGVSGSLFINRLWTFSVLNQTRTFSRTWTRFCEGLNRTMNWFNDAAGSDIKICPLYYSLIPFQHTCWNWICFQQNIFSAVV